MNKQYKEMLPRREGAARGVRLVAAGRTVVLPADTPYARQVLVDHIASLVKRHGAVRLSAGRRAWWLTLTQGEAARCGACRRPIEYGVRQADGNAMCVPCASRSVVSTQAEREPSAA